MGEIRYMISDASKRIDVESHVLRYWELELAIEVPRNELGHRYYSEEHIELLKSVKALKEKGFQLKAIKLLLPEIKKVEALEEDKLCDLKSKLEIAMGLVGLEAKEQIDEAGYLEDDEDKLPSMSEIDDKLEEKDKKMIQFRQIMFSLMEDAIRKNNDELTRKINTTVTASVVREFDYRMRLNEEKEEERFKQLDRTLRDYQQSRQQIAASKDNSKRKPSKFFQKNKVRI